MKDIFENITDPKDILEHNIELERKIPDEMPKYTTENSFDANFKRDLFGSTKEFLLRDEYIKFGMFGFVSWRWINPFIEWINGRKCLEIMSGRGWISHALRTKGVDIIATDDYSWHSVEKLKKWNDTVTEIEKIDAVEAIKKYGKQVDIVIVSWPYTDETTYNVLKFLHQLNPDAILVFIGEWNSDVCASEKFYNNFCEIEDKNFQKAASLYQRWFAFKDYMYLGRYNKNQI